MIKVTINPEKLDTQKRKLKAFEIEREMELILNSSEFKARVLRLSFLDGELSAWRQKSNLDIYDHIMSGAETLSPEVDYELDLSLDDYYSVKKVIGYTYPNTATVYTNTKYFDSDDISPDYHHRKQSGSNFLHEYFHKLGFSHDFSNTKRRPRSLCYQGNRIYEECWDMLIAPQLKKVEVEYTYRKWFKTYRGKRIELHGSL